MNQERNNILLRDLEGKQNNKKQSIYVTWNYEEKQIKLYFCLNPQQTIKCTCLENYAESRGYKETN